MKKTTLTLLLSLLCSSALLLCSKSEAPALSFSVSFLKGEAERLVTPAKLKTQDSLPASETVKTAPNAVLDLGSDLGSMRLLGDTQVALTEITANAIAFDVSRGNILVKASKLQKGQSLRVVTPTVTCAVRGTQFWGQVNPESETGTFAVREGSVEITRKSDSVSIVIEQGQALDIDPKVKDWKVRTAKQGELDAMAQIDEIK